MSPRPFLTARWRYLAMLNYEVPPEVLAPLVPAGTELDSWQGRTFASVVGFLLGDPGRGGLYVMYGWRLLGRWNGIGAVAEGSPPEAAPGAEEEFITEHY